MLQIDTFTQTRLMALNVRTENHGDGLARAVDLKCQMDAPNTFLNQLDPKLLDQFFLPVERPEAQAPLEGVPETKPVLRSHSIKFPINLEGDYSGYQITVDRGLGGSSNMVLQEVHVNKLKLTCLEGGSVQLQYRLQVSNVGDEVIGRLSSYIKADMFVALLPSKVKEEGGGQAAIDGTVGHPGAKKAEPAAAPAPTGHEAGDALAAAEAAGKNKPGSEVPKPKPARKKAKQPSLAVQD